MAKPRVFISSTFYDLKHIRASLNFFIERLGYEAILNENGSIPYMPDKPLDESCYLELNNVDIFVLIIGGRYGSKASSENNVGDFTSITKKEYETAVGKSVPIYILIERSVYGDYEVYKKNINTTGISYPYVDSINIFQFIDEIFQKTRNNPVLLFEKFSDIENWLCAQWAGLFRELLRKRTANQEVKALSSQINILAEQNNTLKKYIEDVIKSTFEPNVANNIIQDETKRLNIVNTLLNNSFCKVLVNDYYCNIKNIIKAFVASKTTEEFFELLNKNEEREIEWKTSFYIDWVTEDLNIARKELNFSELTFNPKGAKIANSPRRALKEM